MFCPNCGFDCGNENFCSKCGQNLRVRKKKTFNRETAFDVSENVYCPRCLSTCVSINSAHRPVIPYRSVIASLIQFFGILSRKISEAENGDEFVCMKCGHRWYENDIKNARLKKLHCKHLQDLLGQDSSKLYYAPNGCFIKLEASELTLRNNEHREYTIPYHQIVSVYYHETSGPVYGWLTIRYQNNKSLAFPKSLTDARKDATTIFFFSGDTDVFLQIYYTLKRIAEDNDRINLQ